MQQNNGMSRAAAMAYRVLIRRGVSALPVHPLEILSACRNTVVWADVTAAEQLKIPREALLRQLANAEAITFRQTIQGETVRVGAAATFARGRTGGFAGDFVRGG